MYRVIKKDNSPVESRYMETLAEKEMGIFIARKGKRLAILVRLNKRERIWCALHQQTEAISPAFPHMYLAMSYIMELGYDVYQFDSYKELGFYLSELGINPA